MMFNVHDAAECRQTDVRHDHEKKFPEFILFIRTAMGSRYKTNVQVADDILSLTSPK